MLLLHSLGRVAARRVWRKDFSGRYIIVRTGITFSVLGFTLVEFEAVSIPKGLPVGFMVRVVPVQISLRMV